MKNIGLILAVLLSVAALAQENDTSQLRINKVSEVVKLQYVHAFTGSDDSCVLEIKRYSAMNQLTYRKADMACMGYQQNSEVYLTYEKNRLSKVTNVQNGENRTVSTYSYDKKKSTSPQNLSTFFYETQQTSQTSFTYFRKKKGLLDSTYSLTTTPNGDKELSISMSEYNSDKVIVKTSFLNESRIPVRILEYEYDQNGYLIRFSNALYGERATINEVYYTNDKDGKIVGTLNSASQVQKYFYHENGLLKNVLAYNPKGELEIEYIYKYKYRK